MAGSGPPADDHVVDESDVADARGDGDEDGSAERLDGDEGVGVDEGEVLGFDAGLAHGGEGGGADIAGRDGAVGRGGRGGVEAALEGQRARALAGGEPDVA